MDNFPDPELRSRLQLSAKGIEWAAGLLGEDLGRQEPEPGEWSAHRALWHLVDVEERNFRGRLQRMLAEDTPMLGAREGEDEAYAGVIDVPLAELAARFRRVRDENWNTLAGLDAEQWQRAGIWPDDAVHDITWLAWHMLWHGLDHFAQILGARQDLVPMQSQ
jgi:hypothetical protein